MRRAKAGGDATVYYLPRIDGALCLGGEKRLAARTRPSVGVAAAYEPLRERGGVREAGAFANAQQNELVPGLVRERLLMVQHLREKKGPKIGGASGQSRRAGTVCV